MVDDSVSLALPVQISPISDVGGAIEVINTSFGHPLVRLSAGPSQIFTMVSLEEFYITVNPLDYIPPRNYVRLVFPFALNPGVHYSVVYQDLQEALRKTFVQEPWASGKVFRRPVNAAGWRPGQLEIRAQPHPPGGPPPHQLRYKELDTDWTYIELKEAGFPSNIFPEELLLDAPRLGDIDKNGADVLLAQANFLQGGLLLGLTTSHVATDAAGMLDLFKLWAENFRELHGRDVGGRVAPTRFSLEDHDRTLPDRIWERMQLASVRRTTNAPDDTWLRGLVSLDSGFQGDYLPGGTTLKVPGPLNAYPGSDTGRGRMLNRVMFLSARDLLALQTECALFLPPLDTAVPSPLTVSDAINALLWRTLLRARAAAAAARSGPSLDPISVFESPEDVRSIFAPDFPSHYLGNCFLLNTARMPLSELISTSTPLGRIAHALREGATRLTGEAVHRAYGLLRSAEDLSRVRGRFVERMDSADLLVSNIISFPMEELNFGERCFEGGGRPQSLRVLHGQYASFVRLAHILPRNPGHGGVEVSVNLFEDEMGYFDQEEEVNRYLVTLEV